MRTFFANPPTKQMKQIINKLKDVTGRAIGNCLRNPPPRRKPKTGKKDTQTEDTKNVAGAACVVLCLQLSLQLLKNQG